jgi:hypothetical protein
MLDLGQNNNEINYFYLYYIHGYLIDMTRSWINISDHSYLFPDQRYPTLTMS